jgi:hypothetical protein
VGGAKLSWLYIILPTLLSVQPLYKPPSLTTMGRSAHGFMGYTQLTGCETADMKTAVSEGVKVRKH